MKNDKVLITEIFESFQGESYSIGQRAIFIRVAGCNLKCDFCDSKFASRSELWKTNYYEYTLEDLAEHIDRFKNNNIDLIVVTGGEPLLYKKQFCDLAPWFPEYRFEFETNGTIEPPKDNLLNFSYNVSPKLPSSGNKNTIKYDVLKEFAKRESSIFKFVITDLKKDIAAVRRIQNKLTISDDDIYLMPEGATSEKLVENSRKLWEYMLEKNIPYKFAPRLQVYLYGTKRGV